jgi:MFS family permease
MNEKISGIKKLAIARGISILGGGAASLTLTYLVFERTDSAGWVTLSMLLTIGAQSVFLPAVGGFGDRWNRKHIMIASDCISALLWAALFALQDASPTILVGVACLASLAEAPFLPASSAAIVSIAGPQLLTKANSVVQTSSSLGRLLGPLLGGALYVAIGPSWLFAINSASFILSALLVLRIRESFASPRLQGSMPSLSIVPAVTYIRKERTIRLLLVSSMMAYVTTSFAMVAEPLLADSFGVGALGYGLMLAGWGVGLVLGSYAAGLLKTSWAETKALVAGRILMGSAMTIVPLLYFFPVVPLLFALGGFGSGVILVALTSQVQRLTGDEIRSRVFALLDATGTAGFVVGVLGAGYLVSTFGPRTGSLLAGLGTLLATVPLLLNLLWTKNQALFRS